MKKSIKNLAVKAITNIAPIKGGHNGVIKIGNQEVKQLGDVTP